MFYSQGLAVNSKETLGSVYLNAGYGHGISDRKNKYFVKTGFNLVWRRNQLSIGYNRFNIIVQREENVELPQWVNTFYSLFYGSDYFDYYYSNGQSADIILERKPFSLQMIWFSENHSKAERNVRSGPIDGKDYTPNADISDGHLSDAKFLFKYSTSAYRRSDLATEMISDTTMLRAICILKPDLESGEVTIAIKNFLLDFTCSKIRFITGFWI